ncbi:MAG: hypothetical protein Ct9H300mP25_05870 [Acidobacteriota bacterium]|nr:MAG: hypothetical protein Ct9H300mP25_05870 [Acidobacteriota bacterium]
MNKSGPAETEILATSSATETTKQAVLIDPSYSPDTLVDRATSQHLVVAHIINTHGHPDHTEGNDEAARLTGAKIAAHPDGPIEPDISLSDGQTIPIGILQLQCLHVPGHASDHLVLYEPSYQLLFTGDLIFVGKVGGTATEEDATIEWTSLQRVLSSFPNSLYHLAWSRLRRTSDLNTRA